MSVVKVEVDGRQIRRALRSVGADLTDLKDANAEVAQIVAESSRTRAPHRSGDLARSLKGNRAVSKAVVSSRLPYANPIHWGTGARAGLRGPHNIARRPFIVESAQMTQSRWTRVIITAIQRAIDKAGLGGGG